MSGIDDDIFDNGTEADRIEYDRLVLAGEIDALRVTPAFEVEHGAFAPAMLVVADQKARRICRERGFARAGQTEKQRDVTIFAPVFAEQCMGNTSLLGQQKIQHGEHRLFHLAGVTHPREEHTALREVDGDHAIRLAVPSPFRNAQANPGALAICQTSLLWGLWCAGLMKSARPNSACQANSVVTSIGR